MSDIIGTALKKVWTMSQDDVKKGIKGGDFGLCLQGQGAMAAVIQLAKELGYEVETKVKQNDKEESGASSKPVRRTQKSAGTKKPAN